MVREQPRDDGTMLFMCEFCGSAYMDIETAEDCEQHCSTRESASAEIRSKAVQVPKIQVIPVSH